MAAAERNSGVRVGERVFVHPADSGASFAERGIVGRVVAIADARAAVLPEKEETPLWISVDLLRPERRRGRTPATAFVWGA